MSRVRVTYLSVDRRDVIERLRQAAINLEGKLLITKLILYGSYARGGYTARSDIDIVVVYSDKQRDDAYKLVMDQARLARLEPRIYTEEQFRAVLAASPKFADELVRGGIMIVGAEHHHGRKEQGLAGPS